jgi:hypothetical protein
VPRMGPVTRLDVSMGAKKASKYTTRLNVAVVTKMANLSLFGPNSAPRGKMD